MDHLLVLIKVFTNSISLCKYYVVILKYVSTKYTFSDDDKEVAKLEKEIKSLKAQIKDFKEMIADVKKIKDETTNCKKDLEKFLSKIKLDIYKPDK